MSVSFYFYQNLIFSCFWCRSYYYYIIQLYVFLGNSITLSCHFTCFLLKVKIILENKHQSHNARVLLEPRLTFKEERAVGFLTPRHPASISDEHNLLSLRLRPQSVSASAHTAAHQTLRGARPGPVHGHHRAGFSLQTRALGFSGFFPQGPRLIPLGGKTKQTTQPHRFHFYKSNY